jgi:uncharacterized protein YdcH (DUF465 family)
MDENSLREILLKENEDFRHAAELHRLCDRELEDLQKKSFPTEEEKVRIRELKKKKLIYKDKLYHILSDYKESRPPKS